MRLGVISDIHGNAVAFDAVLADLERSPVDRVVCLGDTIQGGPQPAEVAQRLSRLACPVVMGNADAFVLSGIETARKPLSEDLRASLDHVRAWTLSKLSSEERDFIGSFAPTVSVPLGDAGTLLCFHGSPDSFEDLLLPETPSEEFDRLLGPHRAQLFTGGHVHVQFHRRIGDGFHFNPGSVGLAYRHGQPPGGFRCDPWADYAVLTVEGAKLALEFRRVPFDVDAHVRIALASGIPSAQEIARNYGKA